MRTTDNSNFYIPFMKSRKLLCEILTNQNVRFTSHTCVIKFPNHHLNAIKVQKNNDNLYTAIQFTRNRPLLKYLDYFTLSNSPCLTH